jgi:hypothetical protein
MKGVDEVVVGASWDMLGGQAFAAGNLSDPKRL